MDPVVGILGAIVIARWSWSLMRDTAAILLDQTVAALAAALNDRIGAIPGLRLADLHVWRVGPQARAAIVEVEGEVASADLHDRLADLRDIAHLTIAVR
jgi:Co/Zn/Cd efflux system component